MIDKHWRDTTGFRVVTIDTPAWTVTEAEMAEILKDDRAEWIGAVQIAKERGEVTCWEGTWDVYGPYVTRFGETFWQIWDGSDTVWPVEWPLGEPEPECAEVNAKMQEAITATIQARAASPTGGKAQ